MKNRSWIVAILLISFSAISSQVLEGTVMTRQFWSTVSKDSVPYSIYLPPNYANSVQKYPVVYHLHGIGGTHNGNQITIVPRSYENALAQSTIGPVIIVFPDGMKNSMWADSKDSAKPVETHVIRELIPHIDSTYRTRPQRASRIVQGYSMGGYGAIMYAVKYPQLFAACVSYDGALHDWSTLTARKAGVAGMVFDNDEAYFNSFSPRHLLVRNQDVVRKYLGIRQILGGLKDFNQSFKAFCDSLNTPVDYVESGCDHNIGCLFDECGEKSFRFIASHLDTNSSATPPVDPLQGLTIKGDPFSGKGATWTYKDTVKDVAYDLTGILVGPGGDGPFPAVVINHGKGGSAPGYSLSIAKAMRTWGVVCIGVNLTHAARVEAGSPGTSQEIGASSANIHRAHKCVEILRSLPYVDGKRIAAHGHSMGAYLTAALVGTHTPDFLVASHTAGGVNKGPAGTKVEQALRIATPYQMHHGTDDNAVLLRYDQALDSILAANGTVRELVVYDGYDHGEITFDSLVLARVKTWYESHGLFEEEPVKVRQPSSRSAHVPALFLQNSPNPFVDRTMVYFMLPQSGFAVIEAFDPAGRMVATLARGMMKAGKHTVEFSPVTVQGTVSSGTYVIVLSSGKGTRAERITRIRCGR